MAPMPQPGDPYASAFVAEVGHCWRVVHGYTGQAAHCAQSTTFTGRWYSPRDDRTYWRVWSCPDHLDGLVAIAELGVPLHPEYFSTRFETLTDRAGLRKIRLHDLRHTAASHMIAAGVLRKVVAELLGHASPTIKQTTYQHVMPGMSEAAGEGLSESLLG
jgi:integrase